MGLKNFTHFAIIIMITEKVMDIYVLNKITAEEVAEIILEAVNDRVRQFIHNLENFNEDP